MARDDTAIVFDIQKYSIHDGPGIRTLVFLKGCPLACPWCSNPESQISEPQLLQQLVRCIHCLKCMEVCSRKAISLESGEITIDRDLCDTCGVCADQCYANALQIVGREMTVSEVVAVVKKDIQFYIHSGGGVTFGGGEPLLHAGFIRKAAGECKQLGISTAVETCGYADASALDAILPVIDLFLFDIKHIDAEKHAEVLGVSNELILRNAEKIASSHMCTMIVRIPIIPGFNDSVEVIGGIADFVRQSLPIVEEIHLLPFHQYGAHKYGGLNRQYELKSYNTPGEKKLRTLSDVISRRGFRAVIGG